MAPTRSPHARKNFIPRNEGFVCDSCQYPAPPARGTFRNHCPNCLASKHVDHHTPGDRQATCHGLMPAIALEGSPANLKLLHQCQRCDKQIRNRVAPDDSYDQLIAIASQR